MSIGSVVVSALVAPVVEICDSCLVHLVVGIKPGKQHLKRRVRINLLEFVLISIGQTANRDERIAASSTTTHNVYATACRELLVVGYGHHTAIHKFPHRDAKSVIVVLHTYSSLSQCCSPVLNLWYITDHYLVVMANLDTLVVHIATCILFL